MTPVRASVGGEEGQPGRAFERGGWIADLGAVGAATRRQRSLLLIVEFSSSRGASQRSKEQAGATCWAQPYAPSGVKPKGATVPLSLLASDHLLDVCDFCVFPPLIARSLPPFSSTRSSSPVHAPPSAPSRQPSELSTELATILAPNPLDLSTHVQHDFLSFGTRGGHGSRRPRSLLQVCATVEVAVTDRSRENDSHCEGEFSVLSLPLQNFELFARATKPVLVRCLFWKFKSLPLLSQLRLRFASQ